MDHADQSARAKYGETLPQLESLYRELTANSLKQNALNGMLNSGNLIEALEFAYKRPSTAICPQTSARSSSPIRSYQW